MSDALTCASDKLRSNASFSRGVQVCCSANHSIALVKSLAPGESGLWSWGSGDGGRLGHGDVLDRCVVLLLLLRPHQLQHH